MDSVSQANLQQNVANLTAQDKQDLNQFIQAEQQKANLQQTIHEMNSMCFTKCITGKISGGALDRNEESCTKNCVDRYMDANMAVIRHLEKMRSM